MDVSIIFVNYKTMELTADAIRSVFDKTDGISYEVIVVDNASGDGSSEYLRDTFGDRITVIDSDKNGGFGYGNNIGIVKAAGKYIFLLNTDTLLINNAIKALFDFMETHAAAGVCGGNLFNGDGTQSISFGRIPKKGDNTLSVLCREFMYKLTKRNKYFNDSGKPKKVGYISGADLMIRADVLSKAGLFDTDFFMYMEEVELTHRIKKLGYEAWSVPAAEITHFGGKSGGSSERARILDFFGRFLFYQKSFGIKYAKKHYRELGRAYRITAKLGGGEAYNEKYKYLTLGYQKWLEHIGENISDNG